VIFRDNDIVTVGREFAILIQPGNHGFGLLLCESASNHFVIEVPTIALVSQDDSHDLDDGGSDKKECQEIMVLLHQRPLDGPL
jgi:hypothetical protein